MLKLIGLFCIFARNLEGDGLVQPTGKYCSIRQQEYPGFQTQFLVEWKVPTVSRHASKLASYFLFTILGVDHAQNLTKYNR